MVKEVKVHFIDNFQHAAIDLKTEMTIHKGPSETLITLRKLPECDPLRGNNAIEYTHWAEETWKREFEAKHDQACQDMDTQKAWKICEAFDEKCVKRRILLQGIDDETLGEGRGKVPEREPRKAVPKVYGKHGQPKDGCNATNG